jgi:uncharacterized membrane protein YkvI
MNCWFGVTVGIELVTFIWMVLCTLLLVYRAQKFRRDVSYIDWSFLVRRFDVCIYIYIYMFRTCTAVGAGYYGVTIRGVGCL